MEQPPYDTKLNLAEYLVRQFSNLHNVVQVKISEFVKFIGPTSEKIYTLPDADATLLYVGGPLGTPNSGNFSTGTFTWPTFNQSTSGTAATADKATILVTPRAIYGNNFDGSAALSNIIASAYGGTGSGFAKFIGPTTTEKTFTLPDANATLLYAGVPLNGTLGATTPATASITNLTLTAANSATTGAGQLYINGATGNRIDFGAAGAAWPSFTTRSVGTKLVLFPAVGASAVDYAIGIGAGGGLWNSVANSSYSFSWYAGENAIATLSGTGNLTVSGSFVSNKSNSVLTGLGQLYLDGATGNRIDFNTNGWDVPTFTTRSVGTKICLYPSITAATVDIAIGVASSVLWNSVDATTSSFKWYGGTTLAATLTGAGALSLTAGQIGFPSTQVASSNANTLDDYEEATYTPTTSGIIFTGANASAYTFTKIGRQVTLQIHLEAGTSVAISAASTITLPFACVTTGVGVLLSAGILTRTIYAYGSLLNFTGAYESTTNFNGTVTYFAAT
jgi:hypothetical protein